LKAADHIGGFLFAALRPVESPKFMQKNICLILRLISRIPSYPLDAI
jgi:hypothetical protein